MNLKKLGVVAAAIMLWTAMASACPMCKDSIPNSDAQQASALPGGFNASIYYMLGGLFATSSLVLGVVVKGVRNANRKQ